MFGTIRVLFFFLLLDAWLAWQQKHKGLRKAKVIVAVLVATSLCTISHMVPVENAFLTFSTPEKAFRYVNSERVILVVEGEESALVIGEREAESYVYLCVPKCADGWKLGRGIDTKRIEWVPEKDITIELFRYKTSSDYYITITVPHKSSAALQITDSCSSTFVPLHNEEDATAFSYYFAYVTQYDEDYWLNIDGKDYDIR